MAGASSAAGLEAGARTVLDALSHWGRHRPGSRALSAGEEELGYADLLSLVEGAAERLRGAGVTPGERVALIGGNSIEWAVAFFAGLRAGAVVVPLNSRLSPLEIRRQVEVAGPRLVLAGQGLVPLLERAGVAGRTRVALLERTWRRRSLWGLRRASLAERPPPPDAPALISFTSGTTGLPRGAVIQHGALLRSASAFVPHFETSPADSTLVLVPLFHNTGFVDQLCQMMLVGGAVDLLPEFGVAAAAEALARRPATYLIAVPSIFRLLMLGDAAELAFRSCRVAAYGGSSMPTGWIEELAARWPGLRLFNCYGLTEFTSVSHLLAPEHALSRSDSVGRPVEGVRQLVAGERGRPLPPGELGEVWLAGPMRMLGYWQDEASTRAALHGEWLRTGDLGRIDEEGFLSVAGRSADVINRGGEKIHAVQVEAALSRLASVADAAVVGAPHPVLQERVVACVVVRAGHELDEEEARRHLLERVPDYAVPETFVHVDELPRNAAGKLDRRRIRAEVAALTPADTR